MTSPGTESSNPRPPQSLKHSSIKSNFVTFVVAYAPTVEAPEGQKTKNMAALSCTVASMPSREYVFVLTDANAETEKRGEG